VAAKYNHHPPSPTGNISFFSYPDSSERQGIPDHSQVRMAVFLLVSLAIDQN
jgi:hypothetical protein